MGTYVNKNVTRDLEAIRKMVMRTAVYPHNSTIRILADKIKALDEHLSNGGSLPKYWKDTPR
jgi:hypothetical protein